MRCLSGNDQNWRRNAPVIGAFEREDLTWRPSPPSTSRVKLDPSEGIYLRGGKGRCRVGSFKNNPGENRETGPGK